MNRNERISTWINKVLKEMSKLEEKKGMEILQRCGAKCSESSKLLAGAKRIRNDYAEESNLDIIFKAFKLEYYNTARLSKEGNRIILIFKKCTCPMVKEGVDQSYLCNCTVGYTKRIFETLFSIPVDVSLEKSILRGDKICKQIIIIDK